MAQEYKGTVLGNDGKPLSGVKVTLKSGGTKTGGELLNSTTTDKNGFFIITTNTNIPLDTVVITFTKNNYTLYTLKNPQPTGIYPSSKEVNKENVTVIYYEGKIALNGQNGAPIKINQTLTPQDTIYIQAGDIVELQFQDTSKIILKSGVYKIENIIKPIKSNDSNFKSIFGEPSSIVGSAGIRR